MSLLYPYVTMITEDRVIEYERKTISHLITISHLMRSMNHNWQIKDTYIDDEIYISSLTRIRVQKMRFR